MSDERFGVRSFVGHATTVAAGDPSSVPMDSAHACRPGRQSCRLRYEAGWNVAAKTWK
jgi:hypothetical protein